MFDTMEIAKRIKQARIEKNMTQLQLADVMGVSYQAVSNWERGNSMPDISKLGDLCSALDLTVNELLGMEEKTAAAVTKAMEKEELTVEELKEVAPMLPPEQIKEQVESKWNFRMPDLSFLEKLPEMIKGTFTEENIDQLKNAANTVKETFDDETVEKLKSRGITVTVSAKKDGHTEQKKSKKKIDLSAIAELAPFLDEEYLDSLVENADLSDLDGLDELAPFLSEEALDKLVRRCEDAGDYDALEALAPFLSKDVTDRMIDRYIEKGCHEDLSSIYPFLRKETMRKLATYMLEQEQTDPLDDVKDYL